jgi:anti-sigma factor ChrR (cupin superfamily)
MTANTTIPDLLLGAWQEQSFQHFRQGIEICTLHEPAMTISSLEPKVDEQPVIALLRYQASARVPRHRHPGVETILVLAGTQSDEDGCYPTGSLVINPVGSEHSVWSDQGCVVLIQWDKPVQFF